MNRAEPGPGEILRSDENPPEILKPELSEVWKLLDSKNGEV